MTTAKLRRHSDGPALPAEFTFLLAILGVVLLLALAGVPLVPEREAGDGSDSLRKGWLQERQAEALAEGQERPSRY
ncbi:MAG: hypothetical protein DHS20C15_05780 [Planctomycetota bacterium]|nr:MAG: hypothetical protein DHS20C15_05780 [Planctomycetota bacterium]